MAKKVLTALKDILYSIGLLNCGAVLIFMFYGSYMSCEKANDELIYGIIAVSCLITWGILEFIVALEDLKNE